MTDDTTRYERAVESLSRRRVLGGGATLLTAGGTLVWVGDPTQARVSIAEFTAANQSWEQETVTPVVEATLAWDYDVGTEAVAGVRPSLAIDGTVVASERLRTDKMTLSNETSLSAPLADSDAWSTEDFAPGVGEIISHEVAVEARFAVLDSSDAVIAEAAATDTATLEVAHPQDQSYSVSVGGSATFRDQ